MAANLILNAHPELGPEIKLLLHLQSLQSATNKIEDNLMLQQCQALLMEQGHEFFNEQANIVLQSIDGKCDWNFILNLQTEKVADQCVESRKSCWCKLRSKQNLSALKDLSRRLLSDIIETVQAELNALAEIIILPWDEENF